MTLPLADRLARGDGLLMVNAKGAALPEDLPGADALFVDREGTGLALAEARAQVGWAHDRGLLAILRCDGPAAGELSACAATGADALVLPQIAGADDLRACLDTLTDAPCAVIAQIETPGAVASVAALMALPGVAAFLIGPNDLAAEMGHPGKPDHPEVSAAVDRVAETLRAAGRAFGLPTLTPQARRDWAAQGAQLFYLPLSAFEATP